MHITEELVSRFREHVIEFGNGSKREIIEDFMNSQLIGIHDLDTVLYLMSLIPKIRKGSRRTMIANSVVTVGGAE